VGSGLILLVIVGAWLAVLVPMALRSHDSSTSLSSVDRFNDAMRVLSRREQTGRGSARTFVLPAAPAEPHVGIPLAVRRRRVLLTLCGLTLVSLLGGVIGVPLGYAGATVFGLLAVCFVVHLRRQAIRKADERALARRTARVRRPLTPQRVAGVPDRMPARPAALTGALPAPAARYEDPAPAPATWDAPEFPVPTYVNAAVAPPRPPRVLDLTRPGEWTAGVDGEDVGLSILDEDDELDDILEGRRASGDW
jgi:hypothetical protein